MLLTTFLLIVSWTVSANPKPLKRSLPTLPISPRLNFSSPHNLVRHDQARARALKNRGANSAAGDPFQNAAGVNEIIDNQAISYVASVNVGSPATTFELIVDTGSSNTWVGAGTPYKRTSTSVQTSNKVSVTYSSGSGFGGMFAVHRNEFTDQVGFVNDPSLIITQQSIGVATISGGFDGVDGVLGIGPVDLTLGTLSPATTTLIPTITDNLFAAGIISAHFVGISFQPSLTGNDFNGEITWGGVDVSKFIGSIDFGPITTTSPANEFWGLDGNVSYGATTILTTTAGTVDTGSTLILLATNAFNKYKAATGGVADANTGLLRITSPQFNNLQTLSFNGDSWHTHCGMNPNSQIWPRNLNVDIGGVASGIYLIVADLGTNSGEGLDFVLGTVMLQRFYVVLDTANRQIGFATTTFTNATTN